MIPPPFRGDVGQGSGYTPPLASQAASMRGKCFSSAWNRRVPRLGMRAKATQYFKSLLIGLDISIQRKGATMKRVYISRRVE